MKFFHKIQNFQKISDLLNFVFANLIEKATHVTPFWNLSRNPDKTSWKLGFNVCKIRHKTIKNNLQFIFFIREKMLTIFGWNLEIWAVQKVCKYCRYRQELSNEYFNYNICTWHYCSQKSSSIQTRTSLLKFIKFSSSSNEVANAEAQASYSILSLLQNVCIIRENEKYGSSSWKNEDEPIF